MLLSLDLFSGYGGISLGLSEYVRPIGYCEIEKYPRAILASRISEGLLPFAPIFPDIRKLRGEIGSADIITAGFPCQDISIAGNGKGLAGERSGLFYEIIRLTKEIRPTFVFLENVPAIRTRGLEQVIKAFTEIGYDCRWTMLSAASIGASHKRERWFLLAHAKQQGLERQRAKEGKAKKSKPRCGSSLADSYCPRRLRENPPQSDKRRSNSIPSGASDIEGWQTKSWWKIEPNVGRVVDGTPFRVDRVKALGNGVVPLQVKKGFEILLGLEANK